MNEDASLFAKYLKYEREKWEPQIVKNSKGSIARTFHLEANPATKGR
jgi:hypothetical protein